MDIQDQVNDVIEGQLVEHPSTALSLVKPIAHPSEVVAAIKQYQITKAQVLDESDYQDAGQGQKFVKKSGWSKLALAFGVSTYTRDGYPKIIYGPDGTPVLAECKAIARAPNGREAEGWGACSIEESRFTYQQERKDRNGNVYARKGDPIATARQKLYHDLGATAETRAKNRACSNLFGNGELSAEEVDADAMPWGHEETKVVETPRRAAPSEQAKSDARPATDTRPATVQQVESIKKLYRMVFNKDVTEDWSGRTGKEAGAEIVRLSSLMGQKKKGEPIPPEPTKPTIPDATRQAIVQLSAERNMPAPDFGDMSPVDAEKYLSSLRSIQRGADPSSREAMMDVASRVGEALDLDPFELVGDALINLDMTDRELEDLTAEQCERVAQFLLTKLAT